MGALGVAMVSAVTFAAVTIFTRQGTTPSMVTVYGSISLNSTAEYGSITLTDLVNSQHRFSTPVTGSSYSVTVLNGHWYNVQVNYTVQTNNCYTNQAGNYVCLKVPANCFRGPIEVNGQRNTMRFDLDCTHG